MPPATAKDDAAKKAEEESKADPKGEQKKPNLKEGALALGDNFGLATGIILNGTVEEEIKKSGDATEKKAVEKKKATNSSSVKDSAKVTKKKAK